MASHNVTMRREAGATLVADSLTNKTLARNRLEFMPTLLMLVDMSCCES